MPPRLRGGIDKMLLARIVRRHFFAARCLVGIAAALARLVRAGVAAVTIGPDNGPFGFGGFFDGLFTLLELGGKGRLRGLGSDRWGRYGVTRYGCGGWGR
jgi:hypothetical protein